jgi:hypothetical protein
MALSSAKSLQWQYFMDFQRAIAQNSAFWLERGLIGPDI